MTARQNRIEQLLEDAAHYQGNAAESAFWARCYYFEGRYDAALKEQEDARREHLRAIACLETADLLKKYP